MIHTFFNKTIFIFYIFFILLINSTCNAQVDTTNEKLWPEVSQEAKPWTRWWWMGSAVDEENITKLLEQYAENGIGGVEITPIYGVKGEEQNYIDFLSNEWIDMLKLTVEKASQNQMGVDMNTGTGWPFGGPQVSSEYAAKKMSVNELGSLTQDQIEAYIAEKGEDLLALSAYNMSDKRINLLNDQVSIHDINANFRRVISITQRNTGQKVKRAAPGGEGLVFNHFSNKATVHYLERFDQAFKGKPGVRCFFNDSYELSSASGVSDLFDTFKRIKGYDLSLFLKEFSGRGDVDDIARIKADYRDVLCEMLLTNFTQIWSDWAAKYGAKTKNQAHGSPGNLIDLYAAVGIPELETFHATNFPFLQNYIDKSDAKHTESNNLFKKFASSAAHLKREKLVSCETFTWLNEHFKTPLYQCKPELDELFVKGVTHVFFHGTAYSPRQASWPGWLFYASVHMEPNNPQWEHIGAMNQYITRCQSILQKGKHTNDFIVLWSPDDYNHDANGLDKKLSLHNSEHWVNMPEIEYLYNRGYQFDFVTDRILQESEVVGNNISTYGKVEYKTIVLPHLNRIQYSSFKKLIDLAEKGATIVFNNFPEKVSGFKDYEGKETEMHELLSALNLTGDGSFKYTSIGNGGIYLGNLADALTDFGIQRETLIDHQIKNISRKTDDGYYYFIANHEKSLVDQFLDFKYGAEHAIFMNPLNGRISKAKATFDGTSSNVRVYLKPGESMLVFLSNDKIENISDYVYPKELKKTVLQNEWKFKALKGGPDLLENATMSELKFWTDLPNSINKRFAGTCEYSTTFDVPNLTSSNFLLRFEKVEASAKVFVNDKEVATLWSFPYEVDVTDYIVEGENNLKMEVSNLGGNRIRYMDQQGIEWKKFHNINIVNLGYKSFNASNWSVLDSGLSGEVELVEQKNTDTITSNKELKKKVK